jgi:hypothetical protein
VIDSAGSVCGTVAGPFEDGKETLGSVEGREFP